MNVIRKIQVVSGIGEVTHELPLHTKIIYLGEHMGDLFIWVEQPVNSEDSELIRFTTFEDDDQVAEYLKHVGSVVLKGTQRVCHVYSMKVE